MESDAMRVLEPIPYAKTIGSRNWYLREGEKLYGPMTLDQINDMRERGIIGADGVVFKASRWLGFRERLLDVEVRFTLRDVARWAEWLLWWVGVITLALAGILIALLCFKKFF